MKADVYKFIISYTGYEEKIWREVDVSSNYPVSKLAYLILATFNTDANHLFYVEYENEHYEFDYYGEQENVIDPTSVTLAKLKLSEGSKLKLVYDYGCEQVFDISFIKKYEMPKGSSINYPEILNGSGKGILDNYSSDDFGEIIKRTDENGNPDVMYISSEGKQEVWDYRDFDVEINNKLVRKRIEAIKVAYEG